MCRAVIGARLLNERSGEGVRAVHGCVTTGEARQLLRLEDSLALLDRNRYYLDNVGGILGVLLAIVAGERENARARRGGICAGCAKEASPRQEEPAEATPEYGFVYLLKSGRFYKIGKTNAVGRRERELAIQLPEKATVIHSIKTDDPTGIEEYWHKRFRDRRRNGEWFELEPSDIAAFRRRKFM